MAIDRLQDGIRKTKNPSVVDLTMPWEGIPGNFKGEGGLAEAYGRYCRELLMALKGLVPAVRMPFGVLALQGAAGLQALENTLNTAGELGYYVILEAPEFYGPIGAEQTAQLLLGEERFACQAVILPAYLGSDALRPFLPYCKAGKSVFLVSRTGNKSAGEIQDLRSGSRLVHGAAAEMANRHGQGIYGKCGYSQLGILASAGAEESTRNLRRQYDRAFLLLDGMDYSSANAKKCAAAFDRFGHGAAVCAGTSITCAWQEDSGADCLTAALNAAQRMKRNLTNYVTIL